jgi:phospholipase C
VLVKRFVAGYAALALALPGATSAGAVGAAPTRAASASPAERAALAQRRAAIAALRKRVKYVFVLYQENRSFDSYFGTFPGADGIYSQPASATLGYAQPIQNVDGTFSTVAPFRLGPAEFAADTDDVGHSHPNLVAKIDVTNDGPQMDKFALTEEAKYTPAGATVPPLKAKQYGELTMAHEDCDTIPLLWNYASRFVLYDHVFQSNLGPSTPGNLTIIGAQAGETQAALHPAQEYTGTGSSASGVPVMNDDDPAWGPYDPYDGATPATDQINLTYATLPLTLAGKSVSELPATDPSAASDFVDTRDDVRAIAKGSGPNVPWGWYQEGYDREPGQPSAAASLGNYVTHHNGPQYFGYIANSAERKNLHGLNDLAGAIRTNALPAEGGVFYTKGGYQNFLGLKPVDPDAAVQANFNGDDDHPGYSDAEISEAMVAEFVNTIATSKYWSQSAIVITWDDSEGDYDHVAPPLTAIGPGVGNLPQDFITDGPRVPLIVVSPFAKTHAIVHSYGDQGSVVKLVDAVFGLTPLADLPDEVDGFGAGAAAGKLNYGPNDGETSAITNLLDAFDPKRLLGTAPPLSASYAYVTPSFIHNLPAQTGIGCKSLGIVPVDELRGIKNAIPADFNPRPGTDPTDPSVKAIDTKALNMRERDIDD